MAGGMSFLGRGADDTAMSPEMQAWLRDRLDQSAVPLATPPGYSGYTPPDAPAAVDGPVVRENLPSLGSVARGVMSGATDAGEGLVHSAVSGFTLPRDVYQGKVDLGSEEAIGRTMDLAGLMAGGSVPAPVPKGALRMFGGGEAADNAISNLTAALHDVPIEAPRPGPRQLDPNAATWDLYHGSMSGQDFARFDPARAANPAEQAVFFAPNPETASGYAGSPKAGAEAGSRVYRTTVEPGKTGVFDLTHLAETDPAFNARAREITVKNEGGAYGPVHDDYMSDFRARRVQDRDIARQAAEMGYTVVPDHTANVSFGYGHIGAAVERAKAQGLDTAILRGLGEHGGDDQVIALTPGRVRSYYDPSQLLYSGGPAGAVVSLPFLGRDR